MFLHVYRVVSVATIFIAASTACGEHYFPQMPRPAEVKAVVGKHKAVLPSGWNGLTCFPDMPICEIKKKPLTFLLVAGIGETYLASGRTYPTAQVLDKVLSVGPAGSIDNNYAGISSVYVDKARKRLVAFYHAEDKEGMGNLSNGVFGAYWQICVAESPLDRIEFKKLGPIISADEPKKLRAWETEGGPQEAWLIQGTGDPYVCEAADGGHLVCIYTEASNRLKEGRGVQVCVARCAKDTSGMPGSWKKFHRGGFSEPGLSGHDTPVITGAPHAEAVNPQIMYVPEWKRYLAVFGVGFYTELNSAPPRVRDSGFYVSTSENATEWSKPVKLVSIFNVWVNGQPSAMHPYLVVNRVDRDSLRGFLRYAYSDKWPDTPHHLAERPIQLSFKPLLVAE
jgi:hypothetical protein